ncbi:hypothetical protein [Luteolibacter sp. Populi]|uniref:hypothetical protein n=1 Tax=Luteolibacter sp. Populi TaxID=3230487 RepID=UPI0034676C87
MLRLLAIFLLAILPASACLWDRDTLRDEAKGKLNTVKAITGWFDRYPPRYYEVRLERVTKELEAKPRDLNLYDDAGVASSRLGRHDEAIAWMEKKKAVLDALPDGGPADDRYRYLSNAGTFYLIGWIVKPEPERNADRGDLQASESFIARALEVNPDAHFGREKFQLMLIRWLLAAPEEVLAGGGDPNFLNIIGALALPGKDVFPSSEFTYEEARKGIVGLIQLGAAWESVDASQALQMCLHGEKNATIAYLAFLRHRELNGMGAVSLHPSPEVREKVVARFPGGLEATSEVDSFYRKARTAADKREKAWVAYQDERFAKGMHPDTHADFWNGWKDPEFPELPGPTLYQYAQKNPTAALAALVTVPILAAIGWFVVSRKLKSNRETRRASAPA